MRDSEALEDIMAIEGHYCCWWTRGPDEYTVTIYGQYSKGIAEQQAGTLENNKAIARSRDESQLHGR